MLHQGTTCQTLIVASTAVKIKKEATSAAPPHYTTSRLCETTHRLKWLFSPTINLKERIVIHLSKLR
ncbi:hypothetical protein [Paenibacillus sp. FSL R5-192]|uniref:hypothetical protein n=1 Tax=Paenibacillus sp. FSL R5-192 TaxID=1226754 RepID=UPI0012EC0674|nr:hypothetical protein [Paenibacillus sp. FSL R5-192]